VNAVFAAPGLVALAVFGFATLFNIRGVNAAWAALGGIVGWAVRRAVASTEASDVFAVFLAAAVIGLYGELIARRRRAPVTTFVISAIIPLVPGGGMYHTMVEALRGTSEGMIVAGMRTLGTAGAIAVGLAFVSSFAHLTRRRNRVSTAPTP
jgi:uncharacterized membrane protein YjjB (DUF3815 family)